jgi:hypothetical protein
MALWTKTPKWRKMSLGIETAKWRKMALRIKTTKWRKMALRIKTTKWRKMALRITATKWTKKTGVNLIRLTDSMNVGVGGAVAVANRGRPLMTTQRRNTLTKNSSE